MDDKEKAKVTAPDPNPEKTAATKPAWYKNKRILLIGAVIVLVVAMTLVYFLVASRPETSKQRTVSNTAQEERQQPTVYQDTGLPGIKFNIPDGWWAKRVTRNGTTEGYTLYSPDAVVEEGYNGISAGTSIRINAGSRDKALEASGEKPVEAYISRAGAPVVNDSETLDRNKLQYSTNKNNIELLAYKWGYEGCFVHILLLGEEMHYSFSVIKGNACPEVGVLESDETIATFIDSIALSDDDTTITSSIFVREALDKESQSYEVRAPNISFEFHLFFDQTLSVSVSGGSPDIHTRQDGMFDSLTLGPTKEVNAKSYQCDGCGFLSGVYDSSIQFIKEGSSTAGYKEVATDTFGKVESVDTIQRQGRANRYTYVKTFDQGAMVVSFVVEVSDDSPLPPLEADFILKTLDSLKVI